MKGSARSCLLAVLLLAVCAPAPSGAPRTASGPSASGDFRFEMDDGITRHLEFNARAHRDGAAAGQMTFSAQGELPDQDVDGEGTGALPAGVFMKAEFDCLAVEGNRAVMSGAVTESNVAGYAGRRVLLVVEDGGEGVDAPAAADRLTWGVYLKPADGWTPSDAERPGEVEPTEWLVSDFDRPGDTPVPFKKGEAAVGCQSFPPSSYSFVEVKHGGGNIQVRP